MKGAHKYIFISRVEHPGQVSPCCLLPVGGSRAPAGLWSHVARIPGIGDFNEARRRPQPEPTEAKRTTKDSEELTPS